MEKRVAKGGPAVGHSGATRKVTPKVIKLLVDKKNALLEKGTLFELSSFKSSLFECHKAQQEIDKPGFNTKKLIYSDKSIKALYPKIFSEKLKSSSVQNEAREKAALQGCNSISFAVQCLSELMPHHVDNVMLANTDRKTFFLGDNTQSKPREFRGQPGDGLKFRKKKKSVKKNDLRGPPRRTLGNDVTANFTGSHVISMLSFKDDSRTGKPIVRLKVASSPFYINLNDFFIINLFIV